MGSDKDKLALQHLRLIEARSTVASIGMLREKLKQELAEGNSDVQSSATLPILNACESITKALDYVIFTKLYSNGEKE